MSQQSGTIIDGYDGGTFSKKEIEEARKRNTPLTMDMAIPSPCIEDCPWCGYREQTPQGLKYEEIISILKQFKDLGGKSFKILGEGEPTWNKDILRILKYGHDIGLKPVLFTCGDIIGNEDRVKTLHKMTGRDFASKLAEYNVTVMLKYERSYEDDIVRRKGFSEERNKTLQLLIEADLNTFSPTHLGFGVVVLKANVEEIPSVYEFALRNNIYPLLCPLMPIGRSHNREYREKMGVVGNDLTQLAIQLHSIARNYGVNVGPADFTGGLPCDIARSGFYMNGNGDARVCEADDYVGNIRQINLKKIWEKISEIKDNKYGPRRWGGKCFPKRLTGVIAQDYDGQILNSFDPTKPSQETPLKN